MSKDTDQIYQILLGRNYQETLFGDLTKFKKNGKSYLACCPFHDDTSPSFSIAVDKPVWNCFAGCGGGDWIEYLGKRNSLTFLEALNKLATDAGIELSGVNDSQYREQKVKLDGLQKEWAEYQGSKDTAFINYLEGRGYTDVASLDVGYNPKDQTNPVYIPDRGVSGDIRGFIRHRIDGIKEKKYMYPSGVERNVPVNFHKWKGREELVLVEGIFDALIADQRGIEGVVSMGTSTLKKQLETAIRYGTKRFILALDNDEAGYKATETAIQIIRSKGLSALVVTLPDGIKDPDDLIREQGIEAFKQAISGAESIGHWKAKRILSVHSVQNTQNITQSQKESVIADALDWDARLPNERAREGEDLINAIAKATGYSPEGLLAERAGIEERQAKEREKESYKNLAKEINRNLEEGNIENLSNTIQDRVGEIRANVSTDNVSQYSMNQFLTEVKETKAGLKTGYDSLDKLISIPNEAITIIAGRPSHGKTTFLFNLMLNMVEAEDDKTFLFFSYEETRKQLALKIINNLGGEVLDASQNSREIENYFKTLHTGNAKIGSAKLKLENYLSSGRLNLVDTPYYVDDLADQLSLLNEQHNIGAVFIDYIQKIKIKGKYGTRQLELQKISEKILETAKSLSLPIVLGCQLGRDKERKDKVRLDNLREAGDIEQDAHLVIGLYNEAMEKAQDQDETLTTQEVELKAIILKNRNGAVNEEVSLTFNRPILKIREQFVEDRY
jgi:DNA primase